MGQKIVRIFFFFSNFQKGDRQAGVFKVTKIVFQFHGAIEKQKEGPFSEIRLTQRDTKALACAIPINITLKRAALSSAFLDKCCTQKQRAHPVLQKSVASVFSNEFHD